METEARLRYVGSGDHSVYALAAADGGVVWQYATNDIVYSSPAVANGTLYVASDDGGVYALDAAPGGRAT